MTEALSFRSLKTRTVQNRFNIIVGLLLFILAFGLVESIASVKVMSGIRAYVSGEGLWSKAQKEADSYLVKYTSTHNESDYQEFLLYTGVQLGDHQARIEMDKPNPNETLVRQGFIQGGNNPSDVDDLIFLYRNLKDNSLMRPAVSTWKQGDIVTAKMIALASEIHALVTSRATVTTAGQAAWDAELATLVARTYTLDRQLTVLENQFSAGLGQASRRVSRYLYSITFFMTGLLGILTLVFAVRSARSIIQLDKQKTEFVSLASHQLRTPLTAMNWYAEALLSETAGPITKQQREYLSELQGGGQRMAALISDLLKMSSLDLGTYHPEFKKVDIEHVINTISRDLQPLITQNGLHLSVQIEPDVPQLTIDEQLLSGVLQNLVSNSVKYSRHGGKISVSVRKQRRNILIHVADNGIGIPDKQQKHIFSKLFRADNAQKVDANGTGLGLYIVKAMTRSMGGKVWFESTEHKGTDFYIRLPIYNTKPRA